MILKGVTPIGFSNMDALGEGPIDIRISQHGCVTEIAGKATGGDDEESLHADGCYVSPGWIDLHTHIYAGVGGLPLDPDLIGPKTGVVMLVDAGSTGEAAFAGFREYVITRKPYPIRAFLNIGSIGCIGHPHLSSISPLRGIDPLRTKECIEEHRDLICGIKVTACRKYLEDVGPYPLMAAKSLAEDLDLPVMVHIGEPPLHLEEVIRALDAGDIITHCFTGQIGNCLSSSPGRLLPLYTEAIEKGILLDIGHGSASFDYPSARMAIEAGIKPYSVSSDLHTRSRPELARSLAWVMSKMLACGLRMGEVISAVTTHPARILRETDWGLLETGRSARLTVFQIESGTFRFSDTGVRSVVSPEGRNPENRSLFDGTYRFRPRYALWDGQVAEVCACT